MNASTRLISNKYKESLSLSLSLSLSAPLPHPSLTVTRRISVAWGLDITPTVHASYRDYPRYSNKFSLLPVPFPLPVAPPVFSSRLPSFPLFPLFRGATRMREVRSVDLRGTSANSVDARAAICKDLLFEFILSFLLGMTFRNET